MLLKSEGSGEREVGSSLRNIHAKQTIYTNKRMLRTICWTYLLFKDGKIEGRSLPGTRDGLSTLDSNVLPLGVWNVNLAFGIKATSWSPWLYTQGPQAWPSNFSSNSFPLLFASVASQQLLLGTRTGLRQFYIVRAPLSVDISCEGKKPGLVSQARSRIVPPSETSLPKGVSSPFFSFQMRGCFLLPCPQF